jgi:hypothetical protein
MAWTSAMVFQLYIPRNTGQIMGTTWPVSSLALPVL